MELAPQKTEKTTAEEEKRRRRRRRRRERNERKKRLRLRMGRAAQRSTEQGRPWATIATGHIRWDLVNMTGVGR